MKISNNVKMLSFGMLTLVVSIYTHWNLFSNPNAINPDEAELLATSRLAALPGGIYSNYNTSTHGFVWPEFLAMLQNVGVPSNFETAHVIAFVLIFLSFVPLQMYAIYKQGINKSFPIFLLINLLVLLPSSAEFGFLNTESLPLFIATIGIFSLIYFKKNVALCSSAFLMALVAYTKYQGFLLFIVSVALIYHQGDNIKARRKNYRLFSIFRYIVFYVLSHLIILITIITQGNFSKFYNSSFKFSSSYSTNAGFGGGKSLVEKWKVGYDLVLGQPLLLGILVLVLIGMHRDSRDSNSKDNQAISQNFSHFIFPVLFLIAFLTISIPGNGFPHYLLFFIWIINLYQCVFIEGDRSCSTSSANSTEMRRKVRNGQKISAFLVVVLLTGNSTYAAILNLKSSNTRSSIEENQTKLRTLMSDYKSVGFSNCQRGTRVLVWGWSSEFTTYFDWIPPDNLVNDANRIKYFPDSKSNVRLSVTRAIQQKETSCIFEALGGSYFGGFTDEDSIERYFPELTSLLNKDFVRIELSQGGRLWIRNSAISTSIS